MDIKIYPRNLGGQITAIPSKSHAHRILICAAFADAPTRIICPEVNQDIEATASCLNALGATVCRTDAGYFVTPIANLPATAVLDCRESGSTLRFMLPVVGALGIDTTIFMSGRLPDRPLSPLWEEMERMGCVLTRPTHSTIHCYGKLKCGNYEIAGNISSQFISGLLFALALLDGTSQLLITGKLESAPYVDMTRQALSDFGVSTNGLLIKGMRPFHAPGSLTIEGDWSNSAFFLAANTLGSKITVSGLQSDSSQGDKVVLEWLDRLEDGCCDICASDIPDLVPILAVVAGAKHGATFTGISRLRLKESDRVSTVSAMLSSLGVNVNATENTLTVLPCTYYGCTINAAGDHRIAMAAAVAATVADSPVTILGAQCVSKSYPSFWDEYSRLGGNYEQL